MKIMILCMVVLLTAGFIGCDNQRTPGGTLNLSYKALKENDLNKFRKTLDADALALYGDEYGMDGLRNALKVPTYDWLEEVTGDKFADFRIAGHRHYEKNSVYNACVYNRYQVWVEAGDVMIPDIKLKLAVTCERCLPKYPDLNNLEKYNDCRIVEVERL